MARRGVTSLVTQRCTLLGSRPISLASDSLSYSLSASVDRSLSLGTRRLSGHWDAPAGDVGGRSATHVTSRNALATRCRRTAAVGLSALMASQIDPRAIRGLPATRWLTAATRDARIATAEALVPRGSRSGAILRLGEREGRHRHAHNHEATPPRRAAGVMPSSDEELPRIDVTIPSPARMYDYYLGGKDNFPVDREAAEEALTVVPQGRAIARANRRFLVRAVRYLAQNGIRQFIDLGTGIPTSPSVHEVAREIVPDARVVYVDNDPVVTVHNRALLANNRRGGT